MTRERALQPVRKQKRSRRASSAEPLRKRAHSDGEGRRWSRFFIALICAVGLGFLSLLVWAILPGPGKGVAVALELPDQLSSRQAGALMRSRGLVRSPGLFTAYLWLIRPALQLKPGPHLLDDSLSPRELAQRLARLPSRRIEKVTMPEGWNHLQLARRLEHQRICSSLSFQRAARRAELLVTLGISGPSVEGYMFPATYELNVDTEPERVIEILVREGRRRLERLSAQHPGAFERLQREYGLGQHQLLTLASIVEKEAADPDERPRVASVFLNRLRDPTFRPERALQSDPTAAYGCLVSEVQLQSCSGNGQVTPAMLRDAANAYNTYQHPGLPPGPISNPGEASIAAVLEPAHTDFLYFVARGDGRHEFSRTFEEHSRAIAERHGEARSR